MEEALPPSPMSMQDGIKAVQHAFSTGQPAPRWPMYVRQAKQYLRNTIEGFDERKYGFASVVDLLRAAGKEGVLRIERDRQGAVRVFPGVTLAQRPAPAVDESTDLDETGGVDVPYGDASGMPVEEVVLEQVHADAVPTPELAVEEVPADEGDDAGEPIAVVFEVIDPEMPIIDAVLRGAIEFDEEEPLPGDVNGNREGANVSAAAKKPGSARKRSSRGSRPAKAAAGGHRASARGAGARPRARRSPKKD
jgi:hypothetical protein